MPIENSSLLLTPKERQSIFLQERLWILPKYAQQELFSFPGWSSPLFFDNTNPIHIEYCSGTGHWITSQARKEPDINWVGIEMQLCRAKEIWKKAKKQTLANLFTICAEGYTVTKEFLPTASVAKIFINFPDPWPKTRHTKYRVLRYPFIEECYRILQPEGTLTIVTDDTLYSEEIIKTMSKFCGFSSKLPEPFYIEAPESYGSSFFDQLFRSQKKTIRMHLYTKDL